MSGGVPAGEGLGDLPSRIQGWIGKARARGGDRIELDFATVELLVRLALRATPTPPIEGRDADVERVEAPENGEKRPDWAEIKRAIDYFVGRVPRSGHGERSHHDGRSCGAAAGVAG